MAGEKRKVKHDYGSHRDGHRKPGRLVGGTPGYVLAALVVAIVALCMDVFNWEPSINPNITGIVESWAELAAQIADNSSGWFVDFAVRPPRPRVGIAMSGGGFRAMTASMAVARGLATAGYGGSNAWSDVTHVSSVSGGSWFSSQLVYSGTFYRQVIGGTNVGIERVVEDWGIEYTTAMRASIRSGSLRTLDPAADANVCSRSCTDTRRLIALSLDFLQRLTENPLIEWEPWVGTFLGQYIGNTFPVNASSATYVDAPRNGLSSTTLIQGLVFPPDAFTPGTAEGQRATLVCETADPNDGLNQALARSTVPLAYVVPGPDTTFTGFNVPPEVSFNLSVNGQLHRLQLPEKPRISTITGASSAALGPVGSPSMLSFVADTLARTTPLATSQEELLRASITTSFAEGGLVEQCLPQVGALRGRYMTVKLRRYAAVTWPLHGRYATAAVARGARHVAVTWPLRRHSCSRSSPCRSTARPTWWATGSSTVLSARTWALPSPSRGCSRIASRALTRASTAARRRNSLRWITPKVASSRPLHGRYMAVTWPSHGRHMAVTWPLHHSEGSVIEAGGALNGGSLPLLFADAPNPEAGFGGFINQRSPIVFAENFPTASEWILWAARLLLEP